MEIEKVISRLKFKFAKSMKSIPHWYTVRQKNNKELNMLYDQLYRYIYDNCYIERFFGKEYKYCDIGEWSYWIMTDDINESIIINRTIKDKVKLNEYLQRNECV